jgi:hypothetical protein
VEEDYRQDYASVDDHHGFSGKTGLQKAVDYSVKLLKNHLQWISCYWVDFEW